MTFLSGTSGLYAIVDSAQTRGRPPVELAEALLESGPVALQLRMKVNSDTEILALARAIKVLAARKGVPFVMNDRADLARLVGADALHLGQEDMPIHHARNVVGSMPIGVSTHTLGQAQDAERAGASLIGFGPVFTTTSKQNADATVGLVALADIVRSISIPVVAIGGITVERIDLICDAGARIAAVIGATGLADDPASAARALHARLIRGNSGSWSNHDAHNAYDDSN